MNLLVIGLLVAQLINVVAPAGSGAEVRFGCLYQPAYTVDELPRLPAEVYQPQPGDILFFDDHHWAWQLGFYLTGAGRPMHVGLVVRNLDGHLMSLEAGYNDTIWVRMIPLAERLHAFNGVVWVRRRVAPLTEEQSQDLTIFALASCTRLFAVHRLLLQATPLRPRGPLRTYVLGKPQGLRRSFMCSELVVEALVHVGCLDDATARPAATYPRDLFFDSSPNLYLNRHFTLAPSWLAPQMWSSP